jgi:hypothetical protein
MFRKIIRYMGVSTLGTYYLVLLIQVLAVGKFWGIFFFILTPFYFIPARILNGLFNDPLFAFIDIIWLGLGFTLLLLGSEE